MGTKHYFLSYTEFTEEGTALLGSGTDKGRTGETLKGFLVRGSPGRPSFSGLGREIGTFFNYSITLIALQA